MDFLGIGPLELIFILIIILIVLGPDEMVKFGGTLGRYLRQLMKSDTWRVIQDTSREIRGLPTKLARQAGIEEFEKELRDGMEFPKIGDFPKSKSIEAGLKEELQFDSWTKPASPLPKETEAGAAPPDEPVDTQTEETEPVSEDRPLEDLQEEELPRSEPDPSAEDR